MRRFFCCVREAVDTWHRTTTREPLERVLIYLSCYVSGEANIALPDDLGVQFTEMFMKTDDNMGTLLSLLEVCSIMYE